jgi:hypothetical protein
MFMYPTASVTANVAVLYRTHFLSICPSVSERMMKYNEDDGEDTSVLKV